MQGHAFPELPGLYGAASGAKSHTHPKCAVETQAGYCVFRTSGRNCQVISTCMLPFRLRCKRDRFAYEGADMWLIDVSTKQAHDAPPVFLPTRRKGNIDSNTNTEESRRIHDGCWLPRQWAAFGMQVISCVRHCDLAPYSSSLA